MDGPAIITSVWLARLADVLVWDCIVKKFEIAHYRVHNEVRVVIHSWRFHLKCLAINYNVWCEELVYSWGYRILLSFCAVNDF
jgi:hypothetical protein